MRQLHILLCDQPVKTNMEESARHLMFHAVVMLLVGLLAGIPYGRAILKRSDSRVVDAWRVAHSSIPMGAILLLVISVIITSINVSIELKWAIAIFFIISAYGFMVSLILGPIVGHRGLTSKGPLIAKVVYAGNIGGAISSLLGTVALLYAAWLNL